MTVFPPGYMSPSTDMRRVVSTMPKLSMSSVTRTIFGRAVSRLSVAPISRSFPTGGAASGGPAASDATIGKNGQNPTASLRLSPSPRETTGGLSYNATPAVARPRPATRITAFRQAVSQALAMPAHLDTGRRSGARTADSAWKDLRPGQSNGSARQEVTLLAPLARSTVARHGLVLADSERIMPSVAMEPGRQPPTVGSLYPRGGRTGDRFVQGAVAPRPGMHTAFATPMPAFSGSAKLPPDPDTPPGQGPQEASFDTRAREDAPSSPDADQAEIHVDGHALGEWMAGHLAQALTRPPTTANFVTSQGLPTWPGQSPFI